MHKVKMVKMHEVKLHAALLHTNQYDIEIDTLLYQLFL